MGYGSIIKSKLHERKMTIKQLAEASGISVNTLYSVTKRDSERLDKTTLLKIANALQVEPYELVHEYVKSLELKEELNLQSDQLRSLVFSYYGDDGLKALSYLSMLTEAGRSKWFNQADDLLEVPRYNQGLLEFQANSKDLGEG